MKYSNIYKRVSSLISRLYKLEVVGQENIPADGAIVAANHTAMMDVLVLSVAMGGRQVRFMAKKELFRIPLVSSLIRSLGAFPVDRAGADVGSIKTAIGLIENGELLGIFPQGTRQGGKDPRTTPVKAGVGLIAYHTRGCVLPVMIENDKMKVTMFSKTRVTIGKPLYYDDLGFSDGGRAEYTRAAENIFAHICELKYGETQDIDTAEDAHDDKNS